MSEQNIKIFYIPIKYLVFFENILILSKQVKTIIHYSTAQTIEIGLISHNIAIVINNNSFIKNLNKLENVMIITTTPYKSAFTITMQHIYHKIAQIFSFKINKQTMLYLSKQKALDGFQTAMYYTLSRGCLPIQLLNVKSNIADIYVNRQLFDLNNQQQMFKYECWSLFEIIGDPHIINYYNKTK